MTVEAHSSPVTILFTDIVNSTQLLQRLGDERARRVFDEHHGVLRDAILANSGDEVKWEGDGVMAAFASTAAAVRCAVSMQEGAQRPIEGELIEMRIGLNVGETFQEDGDYFGTTVVIAQRLCSQANQGQILCSSLVAGLLSGRQAFKFQDVGLLELKGMTQPVAVSEVKFDVANGAGSRIQRLPFVGRASELSRLKQRLHETVNGRGGLVMLAGEPGIGKTRMAEDFMDRARGQGAVGSLL